MQQVATDHITKGNLFVSDSKGQLHFNLGEVTLTKRQ